ncbi:MAG: hypothetical protein OXG42_05345, partial [Chloroflexi bacterium]|nr:hypothetical protein [Chloroflexota bacterium]
TVIEHYAQVICVNATGGGVVAQGPPTEVLTEEILRRTFGRELAIFSRGDVHTDEDDTGDHHTLRLADELQLHMDEHEHRAGHVHGASRERD